MTQSPPNKNLIQNVIEELSNFTRAACNKMYYTSEYESNFPP